MADCAGFESQLGGLFVCFFIFFFGGRRRLNFLVYEMGQSRPGQGLGEGTEHLPIPAPLGEAVPVRGSFLAAKARCQFLRELRFTIWCPAPTAVPGTPSAAQAFRAETPWANTQETRWEILAAGSFSRSLNFLSEMKQTEKTGGASPG